MATDDRNQGEADVVSEAANAQIWRQRFTYTRVPDFLKFAASLAEIGQGSAGGRGQSGKARSKAKNKRCLVCLEKLPKPRVFNPTVEGIRVHAQCFHAGKDLVTSTAMRKASWITINGLIPKKALRKARKELLKRCEG